MFLIFLLLPEERSGKITKKMYFQIDPNVAGFSFNSVGIRQMFHREWGE